MLDLSRVVEAYSMKFFKRGKVEEYAFSVDKKTHDLKIRLCTWKFNRNPWDQSFPAELSLITEEKRLIKVAVLHLQ